MSYTARRYCWKIFLLNLIASLLWSGGSLWGVGQAEAEQIEISGPSGSGAFGTTVKILPNGNFVVTDPTYTEGSLTSIGAVYLYDGATLNVISMVKGSTAGDQTGSGGVAVLSNGNYVVSSPNWNNPTALTVDVGAVTYCDGNTGCTGVVSATNSLMGSTASDNVGLGGITALANGNYVVSSANWDNPVSLTQNVGAATWCNGSTGCVGVVSATNSLVGSRANDNVSFGGVTALSNGNFVVSSPQWDNETTINVGAVTWCSGSTGCVGVVSATNSLVGSRANDNVGFGGVTALNDGNYLVKTLLWDNPVGPIIDAGAATLGHGATGTVGVVTAANSVLGTTTNEVSTSSTNIAYDSARERLVVGKSLSNVVNLFADNAALCGNGNVESPEGCDDGNVANNDGCSITCTVESGYSCSGTPSVCVQQCGNGSIDAGEQCDMGSGFNGQADVCCSATCTFKPITTVCRTAAGVCDVAETCTGSSAICPSDAKSTAVCRASAGVCDVAESCNGSSNTCPSDGFAPSSQVCRASTGSGDVAELCTGAGPTCPPDGGVTGPVFSAAPDSGPAGQRVASWSGVTTPTGRDWIGLYRQGAANTAYLSWQYVSCSQVVGLPRASGSCTFPISASGVYEFRYFRNNGFTMLVTSNTVTVGAATTSLTVSLLATVPLATEGGAAGQLTVSRTGSTTAALTVAYSVNGTATSGTDYTALTGSVTIPADAMSAPIAVTPTNDAEVEGDETVVISLMPNAAYTVGTPNSATVTLADDDTGGGGGGMVLTATPSTIAVGGAVTVSWSGVTSPSGFDWIGVYNPGQGNTAYHGWKYVSCTQTPGAPRASGSCTFLLGAIGTYEFRYLSNAGFTSIATSNSVQASAISVPSGFASSVLINTLVLPTSMAFAPDGRLFIAEQSGRVRIVTATGTLLPTPFVDLAPQISSGSERGLLGIAVDPNGGANPYVYVYYTAAAPVPHIRVSRFVAGSNAINLSSEEIFLELDNVIAGNLNGGAMHFGSDGKLYIATGENSTPNLSQTLSSTLGKMLRVNPNPANLIPTDNPFVAQTTGRNQAIYALGLRNPFTFAVHPANGRIFINDVGRLDFEEVNELGRGLNYGWPLCEGPCADIRFTNPIYAYDHSQGCSIIGGTFDDPRMAQLPTAYEGNYFFADFCNGWIRRLDPANGNTVSDFSSGYGRIVDLDFGPDGSLYVLDTNYNESGTLLRVVYQPTNQSPTITLHPTNARVGIGQTATFTVSAVGSAPLTYQWQKNGSDIAGATAASYTLPNIVLADDGATFRCRVTNSFGSITSNPATLTVVGYAPSASILTPISETLYTAGQPVSFSGQASDSEDGALPPSAFTWDVDFYHNDTGEHVHPADPPVSGITNGSFTAPVDEETSANVWYRITLTVKDSDNLTFTTFRDVHPRKATINLATNLSGLQLTLDGTPVAVPRSVLSVVGHERTLSAPLTQTINGQTYVFTGWSDGGAATHVITTPTTNTTYTAMYQLQ
jgi:cysteine-rich repeat protein